MILTGATVKKSFEDFIREYRRRMYDIFEATVRDMIHCQRFTVSHKSDFSAFWLYFDYPDYSCVITFPTDILYVRLKKSPRDFVVYIESKMQI